MCLSYARNPPFPHVVVNGAWDGRLLADCKHEISQFTAWDGEKDFFGAKKKRYCGNIELLPPSVVRIINEASSPPFLRSLEQLTGEQALLPDPYLEGGGIHQILTGGFLKIHAHFNWNKRLGLYRRLNVLLYLNSSWKSEWAGALELWQTDMSECSTTVSSEANTMVVFTTDDKSFHGHPHPLACPTDVTRDSIALYYYSPIQPALNFSQRRNSTDYRPIAGDEFPDPNPSLPSKFKAILKRMPHR